MSDTSVGVTWLDRAAAAQGPAYRRIAEALEAAIAAGELQPGDRLPPQRAVADQLNLDLTTVTRGFAEAQARGLLEGAVGRGSFVRTPPPDDAGLIDLTMNLPPVPEGVDLGAMLSATTAAILRRTDATALMAYHPEGGARGQRMAAAQWLAPSVGRRPPEQILLAPGAQSALTAILTTLCRPGDAVLAEPLTYPGLIGLCAQLGLRLVDCASDEQGLVPEAVVEAARRERPRLLYVIPTHQNPTACTMPVERRKKLAAAAGEAGLWIVEDDPYSRLLETPPEALAALAPDRVIHVATLAKTLSPGLRLAYVVCPAGDLPQRLASVLRNTAQMPAPLMAAVAAAWIREGQAEQLLAGVRQEAMIRRALARQLLPTALGGAESLHIWLPLPTGAAPEALREVAQAQGVALLSSRSFAVGPAVEAGVRISLGGPVSRASLERALIKVRPLVADPAA